MWSAQLFISNLQKRGVIKDSSRHTFQAFREINPGMAGAEPTFNQTFM